jgi:hypothetical protein
MAHPMAGLKTLKDVDGPLKVVSLMSTETSSTTRPQKTTKITKESRPNSVRVGPYKYSIKFSSKLLNEKEIQLGDPVNTLRGCCITDECLIVIDDRLPDTLQRETLMHEIMHASCHSSGRLNPEDRLDEESFICIMSPNLLGTLTFNPALKKYLLGA